MTFFLEMQGELETFEPLTGVYTGPASGRIPEILRQTGKSRPLVILDSGVVELAPTREILDGLQDFPYSVYQDFALPFSLDEVKAAATEYLGNQCDCLLAIGGGSAMDLGKLTGLVASNNFPWTDFFYNPLAGRRIPLYLAVPTGANGAEASTEAFVLDFSTVLLRDISRPWMVPAYVFRDLRYLESMPADRLASGLLDMFSHQLELHLQGQNVSAELAITGEHLRELLGGSRSFLEELGELSLTMGKRYRSEGMSFLHGLAHVLTAYTEVSHGRVIAVFLPAFLQLAMDRPELDAVSRMAGWRDADHLLEDLRELVRVHGFDRDLQEVRTLVENNLNQIAGQSALSRPARSGPVQLEVAEMQFFICEVLDICV